MRKLLILVPVIGLAACAQTTEAVNSDASAANVTYETAKYFSTSTRNVRVGNFEQGVFGTQYKARVGGRMYDCRYMRSLVTCENA
ncbi:MAG: hypothetical protein LJE62_14615 [Silicimonas sp.]|jgi:hypothetical protein|nr:hypothetical protein [Silicimonas sp.]